MIKLRLELMVSEVEETLEGTEELGEEGEAQLKSKVLLLPGAPLCSFEEQHPCY